MRSGTTRTTMTIGNNVGIKMRLQGANYTIHSAAHDKAKILMAFSFIFNAAGVNGANVGVTSAASMGEGTSVNVHLRKSTIGLQGVEKASLALKSEDRHINLGSAHAPASPLGFSSALRAAPGMEAPSVPSLSYEYLQVCPTKPPQGSHRKNHKNNGVDSVGKSTLRESTR